MCVRVCVYVCVCVCGTGDGTQGHSTSELYPQPYFLFFILKQGLTKLWSASLST